MLKWHDYIKAFVFAIVATFFCVGGAVAIVVVWAAILGRLL